MGLLHLLTPNTLKIIIDCGTQDFFYAVNERLHDELLYRNIPHDYISRPGAHNWVYWSNAVKYQLLYFNEFFDNQK
jgi:enterochelin esterase-like enzyme